MLKIGKNRKAINLSFSLTAEIIDTVEKLAKINDLNRSELIRIVIIYLDKNPDVLKKILEEKG